MDDRFADCHGDYVNQTVQACQKCFLDFFCYFGEGKDGQDYHQIDGHQYTESEDKGV